MIYGLADFKIGGVSCGYVDQNGFQPAGTAPTRTDVYAAQKKNGPVLTLDSTPGKKAFNVTFIELKADKMVQVIGGTADANGNWTPPKNWSKTDVVDIICDSGHTIRLYKARVSANDFANGINSQNVLGLSLVVEVMEDDQGRDLKTFAPGMDPETGNPVVAEG